MRLVLPVCGALAMGAPSMRLGQTPVPGARQAPEQAQAGRAPGPADLGPALAQARALVAGGRPADAIERLTVLDQADPRVQLLTGVALYHADRRREAIA